MGSRTLSGGWWWSSVLLGVLVPWAISARLLTIETLRDPTGDLLDIPLGSICRDLLNLASAVTLALSACLGWWLLSGSRRSRSAHVIASLLTLGSFCFFCTSSIAALAAGVA